jgi:phosphinothricin acetyltransferase
MIVRPAAATDAAQIADIYNHYILTSEATFEVQQIDPGEMLRRMEESRLGSYPFLVCQGESEIFGYAYANRYKPRRAYKHSVEVSVYIKDGFGGRNIGTLLYEQLFIDIKKGGFHAIIAGISLPNDASIRLHERFGMEKVAHFREVGFKFGRWIDVGYWQRILF